MRPLHRLIPPAAILLTYFLLSAVPFLPVFSGKTIENPGWIAGIELAAWCSLWAVFKRPAVFHWFLLPAFLCLPVDVYLYTFYGQGLSVQHWGIVSESSSLEALEFLGAKAWPVLAALAAVLAWWWMTWRAARRTPALDWTGPSRKAALALLAVLVSALLYGQAFGVASACGVSCANEAGAAQDTAVAETATSAPSGHALPSWVLAPFDNVEFGDTRPFGFLAQGIGYWRERQALSALNEKNRLFTFGAHPAHPDQKPLVVVLVIGESGRYDRWSLNGYGRDTNPLLEKEPNLVNFPDVITPASATRLSLPVMLSRKGAQQTFRTGFPEKSLITAFREAGFATWWISNQIPFGEFDTPVSVFAKEAEVVQFINPGDYSGLSSFDGDLLAPLGKALRGSAPKKLIILHTLGNHWNYSFRHPAAFDRWQPSLSGMERPDHTDAKLKTEIGNSYDNSVLYTDWFLSRVIDTLKSSGGSSAMLYVSDHGENLHDGTCDFALHGHNAVYDFHVPMIAWYSVAYAAAFQEKTAELKSHRNAKLSTENVFHSLLDMADIQYKDEKPEWSFVNAAFKSHPRYVDSYGWANYDHAAFKGACREVIDKGTPLPRKAGPL